jgi:two-component system, OmpR family, sensor histidine kinase BaeS
MRFTIKYKLLLTLLLTTIVVVATMAFLMKWSFERGFLEYVNTVEQEMHNNLVTNLAVAYGQNKGWRFLIDNPRQWREIHRSSIPMPDSNDINRHRAPHFVAGENPEKDHRITASKQKAGKAHFARHRKSRDCLLDVNKIAITHCDFAEADMQLKEISSAGQIVGYLAISPRKKLSDRHDLQFSQQQHRFLLILGICIVLISIIVALPLSRQLVRPVNKLAAATRKLAAGHYQTRIKVDSSDELGELSRDFNSLALTLENNEKARQQWIADISHELRTPLSILRGEIEALQDGVREVSKDRLQSLHSQIMNLNRLVNDLYELSMSDIGALNYQKQPVDVADVLQRSVDNYADEFNTMKISIDILCKHKLPPLLADQERLHQLFSNLLINTLRYTDAGGQLDIRLEETARDIVIIFEDTAPGVPDADIPHLFERLYRVEASRNRETGGTGLGLAICKNIVEAHEGKISAVRSEKGGLKVLIQLPKG